jgi:hypothetical protein
MCCGKNKHDCQCKKNEDLSNFNKWKYTIYTSIVLFIIFNPYTYSLSNSIFGKILGKTEIKGCPTILGLIIHIIIFTFVIRYIMELPI